MGGGDATWFATALIHKAAGKREKVIVRLSMPLLRPCCMVLL